MDTALKFLRLFLYSPMNIKTAGNISLEVTALCGAFEVCFSRILWRAEREGGGNVSNKSCKAFNYRKNGAPFIDLAQNLRLESFKWKRRIGDFRCFSSFEIFIANSWSGRHFARKYFQ